MKSAIPENKKPVVIVTGCSSGIGCELASQLYNQLDYRVVATCRRHSLDALKKQFPPNERFQIMELDITHESAIYTLINHISCTWGQIDVLVNNAAICYRGVVEHMDSISEFMQIRTNYLGPMALIRAVLPIMREQRRGHIINVSSVSGMIGMPTMSSYSASKHALKGATEALWYESRPFGIRVNLVELGFIRSDSYKNVVMSYKADMSTVLNGPHSEYYDSMVPFIEKLMQNGFSTPLHVARKIIKCIKTKNSRLRIHGTLDAALFNILNRILPSHWLNLILYRSLPGSVRWGGLWKA